MPGQMSGAPWLHRPTDTQPRADRVLEERSGGGVTRPSESWCLHFATDTCRAPRSGIDRLQLLRRRCGSGDDVVRLAPPRWPVTAGERALLVPHDDRGADRPGEQPPL